MSAGGFRSIRERVRNPHRQVILYEIHVRRGIRVLRRGPTGVTRGEAITRLEEIGVIELVGAHRHAVVSAGADPGVIIVMATMISAEHLGNGGSGANGRNDKKTARNRF